MAVSPVSGVVQKIIEPFNQYYNVEIYIRGPFLTKNKTITTFTLLRT